MQVGNGGAIGASTFGLEHCEKEEERRRKKKNIAMVVVVAMGMEGER